MKLQPLDNASRSPKRVRRDDRSGLVIPTRRREKPQQGEGLAVGPSATESTGELSP